MCRKLIPVALLFVCSYAIAGRVQIWTGWMNEDQCRTVVWKNDGFMHSPSPHYHESPQELHVYVNADVPDDQAFVDVAVSCGQTAAATAGVTALLTNPGAAWPAFETAFVACSANEGKSMAANILQFSKEDICK
jgi:hypothetical protein